MKITFAFTFILATLLVYYIGLDQNSRPPNLRFNDAKMQFDRNMKSKFLKSTNQTKSDYSDIELFTDSIMISNGYVKFGSWYYLNGEKQYFNEILHFSK